MRRFFSITMVCALLAATALPLVAASCPHTKMVMACHRVEHARHCEMMHHESNETAEPESSEPVLASSPAAQDCPMDCCAPSQRTNAMAVAVPPILSNIVLVEQAFETVPVVFTAAGFSSHTDRGPPSV